eukprot:NODE_461_length_820_cov_318.494949_g452_i0.p1 GENE.NODE_461_length_820_cov_318.494949_g452_i0~~NODE_461_length_820_cov_318.494949_g452_i0.p1  ORF type:complete len:151 (+),score=19.27 NODE_461_length_820_cov_318.494949_g452_i0:64-516(+)
MCSHKASIEGVDNRQQFKRTKHLHTETTQFDCLYHCDNWWYIVSRSTKSLFDPQVPVESNHQFDRGQQCKTTRPVNLERLERIEEKDVGCAHLEVKVHCALLDPPSWASALFDPPTASLIEVNNQHQVGDESPHQSGTAPSECTYKDWRE